MTHIGAISTTQRLVAEIHSKVYIGDIWKGREKIAKHVSFSDHPRFANKRCIMREAHYVKNLINVMAKGHPHFRVNHSRVFKM